MWQGLFSCVCDVYETALRAKHYRIEILKNQATPAEDIELGYRGCSHALVDVLSSMRDAGTHHLLLDIVPNGTPAHETLETIARDVLRALD